MATGAFGIGGEILLAKLTGAIAPADEYADAASAVVSFSRRDEHGGQPLFLRIRNPGFRQLGLSRPPLVAHPGDKRVSVYCGIAGKNFRHLVFSAQHLGPVRIRRAIGKAVNPPAECMNPRRAIAGMANRIHIAHQQIESGVFPEDSRTTRKIFPGRLGAKKKSKRQFAPGALAHPISIGFPDIGYRGKAPSPANPQPGSPGAQVPAGDNRRIRPLMGLLRGPGKELVAIGRQHERVVRRHAMGNNDQAHEWQY